VNVMAKEAGLEDRIKCTGWPTWTLIQFMDTDGNESSILRDLFQQEALKRGILIHTTHNISAAHDNRDIRETLEAYAGVMKTLAGWTSDPNPARFLEGTPTRPVFRLR
jgi:glutamate-1-semialdehyde aminotransferase